MEAHCFTCNEPFAGDVPALHKDGVLLLPAVINPNDSDKWHEAVNDLCKEGYKKTFMCDACIREFYM